MTQYVLVYQHYNYQVYQHYNYQVHAAAESSAIGGVLSILYRSRQTCMHTCMHVAYAWSQTDHGFEPAIIADIMSMACRRQCLRRMHASIWTAVLRAASCRRHAVFLLAPAADFSLSSSFPDGSPCCEDEPKTVHIHIDTQHIHKSCTHHCFQSPTHTL